MKRSLPATLAVLCLVATAATGLVRVDAARGATTCSASANPVACENAQTTGVVPQSVWDTSDGDAGDDTIQGFGTDISVDAGGAIAFKIKTTLSYRIDIYRLGYYGGNGARLWQGALPHVTPVVQPACLTDPTTLLFDCGNWSVSATWNVPSTAVSGVYIAKLTATNGDNSQIPFVVRVDTSTADIVYQTSDPTWEAYNTYGGSDFYTGTTSLTGSQARAFKISYNRPFATRSANEGRDFLFSNEYPSIRYLERNGYDTTYIAGVDTDRYGATLLTKHKVFMSVGHDEYWSQAQRSNVEHARDAGVNLMFLSGNEVYWHTRYEPSIAGSQTSYRTLVDYKETWDAAKIDPTPEWTGTWRDPRFADAPGGANPENALTGTMFMSNTDDLAVTVTAAQGRTRLWRNTGLSTAAGSTVLAPHTVGYESDEDVDNGFRPKGLVDLSTTVGSTPQYLSDFGLNVQPGTTTHHLTLYRAASGALVFGAGTIQWSWGLDQDHDGDNTNPADLRMQQATANMLADMRALPTTLMTGLVMPATSTDTQAPTVTITAPTATTLANGSQVTVSGTATDVGGGQVAGVEVTADGGASWHPASGTTSWTWTGVLHGDGAATIQARATDDSANTSAPKALALTSACPCSLLGTTVPATADGGDGSSVELGLRFHSTEDGYVTGVRFYKAATNTGTHVGSLWSTAGTLLATGTFTAESASGWQTLQFPSPVPVTAGTSYVASYYAPNGHYTAIANAFYSAPYNAPPVLGPPLVADRTAPNSATLNGLYAQGHAFPASTYHAANYFVDALFSASATVAPTVTAQTPTPGAASVAPGVTPTATFSKPMAPASLTFTLTDPNGAAVAGVTSYDATSRTATFTPSAALPAASLYTASVTGSDTNGNALPTPATWNFRTAYQGQVGGSCPCTIFADTTVPGTVSVSDPSSVELGVRFSADTDGVVTGVRFYKGALNVGTHTGTLWTANGTQLATAVFTGESSSGWQTATFSTPVVVSAGTTYVASYHTSVGYYSATTGAYASTGYDNFPLHVPVNGGAYSYAGGFPSSSSTADYGVDAVFTVPANVVPAVVSADPGDGDTGIGVGSPLSLSFSTSVLAGTASVTLVVAGSSTPVAGTTTLDAVHRTLTFTPSAALTVGATYTLTENGARSLSGTAQTTPASITFTTSGSTTCPCTLFASNAAPATVDSGDSSAITVGVQVVASAPGYLTGLRFYKAAANTGAHTGGVWGTDGTRLATATFTGESASGWQRASFSRPVAVTVGTTYVVGYYAPNGHYSATAHFFDSAYSNGVLSAAATVNGVYRYGGDGFPSSSYGATNYWVDPIFSTTAGADTTPPSVGPVTPVNGASSVATSATPTATFSENVVESSVTMALTGAGSSVPGSVGYDPATTTATFTPATALARGVTYTVAVSASDPAGNAMVAPVTWSFTTVRAATVGCPCSVWTDATTPSTVSDPDSRSIEVGMSFTSDTAGQVTGLRFYKGPTNTGVHTGTLWDAAGQQLATGTYTGESTTGWQTLTFATPVAIQPGVGYVVSYHALNGGFAADAGQFASAGVDNPPLHVGAHAGRYLYGTSAYPGTVSDTNYWVDPVFIPGAAPDTTPPAISGVTATASGSSLAITWTTDEPATSRIDYGTSPSALNATANVTGLVTGHTVTIPGIAPNTRYYYRVTSADVSANTATSPFVPNAPAVYTPAATAPLTDTAVADFAAGAATNAYVAANGDGEVVASLAAAAEFSGTALPAGWTSSAASGGSSTVANGTVRVLNATVTTSASYASGRAIDTTANLGRNQSIGWVTSSNSRVAMSFSVNAANQLVVTVNSGFSLDSTAVVASGWTGTAHRFRIEWTSGAATFYLDGAQVYTRAFTSYYANLRPQLRDTGTTDGALVVDWLRIAPYAAAGTFVSRVLDAQGSVSWDTLSWDATVPSGTTLVVQVRTGPTAVPGTGWTGWTKVTASGGAVPGTARYAQYQLALTTTGTRFVTPAVRSVSLTFHAT